jgi:hypothetical protein
MSSMEAIKSANVRSCFAIGAIVIDTERPMGRGFQRIVVGPDDDSECNEAADAGNSLFEHRPGGVYDIA